MPNPIEARQEMTTVVKLAWDNIPALIDVANAPLMIESVDGDKEPGNPKPLVWGRLTIRHSEADTFAMGKRYRNTGTLYLNCFADKSKPSGYGKAERSALYIRDAIRAHFGDVEFFRVRQQEAGTVDNWYQYNILAAFGYNERNM